MKMSFFLSVNMTEKKIEFTSAPEEHKTLGGGG